MKLFTSICLLAIGIVLVTGNSSGELIPTTMVKCEQCLKLLSFIRASSDASEKVQNQIDLGNNFCEAVCSDEVDDIFYVDLKQCQMCVNAVNKINSHYQGNQANTLASALSYGCETFEYQCKQFIQSNKSGLISQLQRSKNSHTVCQGVHKC